ncbi:hypothetical protein CBS63078_4801 [Aspergillus niger]|nr:hypothetical protein CBS13152_10033 [Aspergillus niger]KAI2907950.1 hypothetical protein CBS63078_4801 [Aspergillus niger]KAI2932172.1 hypothetical protein CBS147320_2371 [Aspergillus niger]KAI2961740.1 hypothetical protein CBS147322_378 [Aspergillus niger]KAI2963044.1 hypothetical protein CBS147323_7029 [Aspergillus niger]
MRLPEESHVSGQSRQSYYGHNFRNSEQDLSSSFTYGDTKEQNLPDPWVKAPNPYSERTRKDYDAYKSAGEHLAAVKRDYVRVNPLLPRNGSSIQHLREGEQLASEIVTSANNVVAARSGFDHKYPTAYDDLASKKRHETAAKEGFSTARRFRSNRDKIRRKIEDLTSS